MEETAESDLRRRAVAATPPEDEEKPMMSEHRPRRKAALSIDTNKYRNRAIWSLARKITEMAMLGLLGYDLKTFEELQEQAFPYTD